MRNVVVKLGGEVVSDPRLAGICADLRALVEGGDRVTVVHGGGPQATALQKKLGIEPRIVGGRRITDAATLDVMKRVIAGEVNVDLCAALRAAGLKPLGTHGAISAKKRPPVRVSGGGDEPIDFGHVGDPTGFDLALLDLAHAGGYVPVVACLGCGPVGDGAVYNINADLVANQLAVALRADPLVLVTSAPGVLRDVKDPSTRIPRLTVEEGHRAIEGGTVQGGMIPKLEESFQALREGALRIVIVDGEVARAVREPGAVGTTLLR
jgi:acetylglutamate kinase